MMRRPAATRRRRRPGREPKASSRPRLRPAHHGLRERFPCPRMPRSAEAPAQEGRPGRRRPHSSRRTIERTSCQFAALACRFRRGRQQCSTTPHVHAPEDEHVRQRLAQSLVPRCRTFALGPLLPRWPPAGTRRSWSADDRHDTWARPPFALDLLLGLVSPAKEKPSGRISLTVCSSFGSLTYAVTVNSPAGPRTAAGRQGDSAIAAGGPCPHTGDRVQPVGEGHLPHIARRSSSGTPSRGPRTNPASPHWHASPPASLISQFAFPCCPASGR